VGRPRAPLLGSGDLRRPLPRLLFKLLRRTPHPVRRRTRTAPDGLPTGLGSAEVEYCRSLGPVANGSTSDGRGRGQSRLWRQPALVSLGRRSRWRGARAP
jgi:hypothetical protein